MDKELTVLLQAVQEAGQAIVKMRAEGVTVTLKENKDVLTQADLLANDILKSQLTESFPEYGWLSEESVDDEARLNCERVWVVDPIDGTREYAKDIPEYAVSVALVENGMPILASIFNPATNELFSAALGQGAFLNGQPITCKQDCADELALLASHSEMKRGEWDKFSHQQIKPVGSIAYKLGLVAAGEADATFSLGPKSEWDIAAGVLLVSEAGGVVTDKSQQIFHFNQPKILVNGIIASSEKSSNQLLAMIHGI